MDSCEFTGVAAGRGAGAANHRNMWKATVALCVALSVYIPAGGSASARVEPTAPVSLAGVTVIRGEGPASMLVRVPKPVDTRSKNTSGYDRRPPVMLFGDGRIVGFVLTAVEPDKSGYAPSYAGWRAGRCLTRACDEPRDGMAMLSVVSNLEDGVLPTGTYRLYLIADGAPVKVRLELDGLEGQRSLRPQERVVTNIKTVEPVVLDTEPGDAVYWAAASTKLKGAGFPIFTLWVEGDGAPPGGTLEQCAFDETPATPFSYAPGCPGADDSHRAPLDSHSNYGSFWNHYLDLWQATSVSYVSPGDIKRAGLVAFWIKF